MRLILFGTKTVFREVPDGRRVTEVCGRCRAASTLVEHRARRYFTLYFVPVLPISAAETVLHRARCEATYHWEGRLDITKPDWWESATFYYSEIDLRPGPPARLYRPPEDGEVTRTWLR
jgi:hypothetical protein